ncbi:MAG: MFS transporter [Deltaproteobacteria bacterium]|nr:MAG: MFS transporter [Deltaproteobacteria bacterium]
MSDANTHSMKQPRELYMLFFAEMWERFSFYGMRALLTLYLTVDLFESLGKEGAETKAFGIYAAYGSLVYATPFIGGILSDKVLGSKKAVMYGSVMMAIGHFVMAIENEFFLYIALSFLIIGNGFFKPNISTMVGGLYEDNDPRRDGGFTIFYIGINLGAMLAPLVCGYIGETYGWFWGFGLAGVGMMLGLAVFGQGKHRLGENGDPPSLERLKKKVAGLPMEYVVYLGGLAAVGAFALLVRHYELMTYVLTPFAIGVIGIIFITAIRNEKEVRERLFVVIVLLFFSTLFWAFFEQAGSSITVFTNFNVDRGPIKASLFQSVNPAFIMLLAPLFAMMWLRLNARGIEPSIPMKFALGLLLLGFGFVAMGYSGSLAKVGEVEVLANGVMVTKAAAVVPLFILVGGYLLHTMGELCMSPIGLSMVTKLSPKRNVSMVMGAWFLSSAMAHHIGGIIAVFTTGGGEEGQAAGEQALAAGLLGSVGDLSPEVLESYDKLATYLDVFTYIGWTAVGAAVLAAAISPILVKWMHGVR